MLRLDQRPGGQTYDVFALNQLPPVFTGKRLTNCLGKRPTQRTGLSTSTPLKFIRRSYMLRTVCYSGVWHWPCHWLRREKSDRYDVYDRQLNLFLLRIHWAGGSRILSRRVNSITRDRILVVFCLVTDVHKFDCMLAIKGTPLATSGKW